MRLSEYLVLHRLSETAFAKHIGLSQAAVNRYCKGRVPSPSALKAIIHATDGAVTANDFFNSPTSEINSHPIIHPASKEHTP
jgi:predicted transcriptional regulator